MRRTTGLLFVIACAIVAAGCAGARYHMPKVDLSADRYEILGESEGTAVGVHLFQLFPIGLNNKFERAAEQAIAKRNGEALVNISVQERWFWAYILNGYRVSVQGTVVRKR